MPPKRVSAAIAASSSSATAAKEKTSSIKKASVKSAGTAQSSKKKAITTASNKKKRKAKDEDAEDEDDSGVSASAHPSAASSSSTTPASKKAKNAAVAPSSTSTSGITFPVKGAFDWIAALSKENDLPTAISIFLAHTHGLSAHIRHALQKHATHIDLKNYLATLNKMVKDGTVIKDNYNPQYGASATNYYLTAQLKCTACGSADPKKHLYRTCSNAKECNESYCDPCRTNRGSMDIVWYCPTCKTADNTCI